MKSLVLVLLGCIVCCSAHSQAINTFAGKGTSGYSGDGGNAKDCELNNPFGITFNGGNLYIADRHNNCVRKIDAAGTITTIAGTGTAGYSGDGGPATNAALNSPVSIAVDLKGYVCISDLGNNRIRRIDSFGIITTVVGTGTAGFNGDDNIATATLLNSPRGIAIGPSSGSIYIADQGNNRIRRVDPTGNVTTIVGKGSAGFSGDGGSPLDAELNGPYALAFDPAGALYIADVDNQRVRKVFGDIVIVTYAGTGTAGYSGDFGPATAAKLNEPIGLAFNAQGDLFIADGWNGCIRQVSKSGIISTVAGNGTLGFSGDGGPAVAAQLNDPYGVAVDGGGDIYIADYANNRIRYMTHPTAVPVVNPTVSALSIAPNPNNGSFSVYISTSNKEPVHLAVTNVTGQRVQELNGMTNTYIDLHLNIADGIYFLTASTDQNVWHQQIVKGQ